jgi:hypothetical protein
MNPVTPTLSVAVNAAIGTVSDAEVEAIVNAVTTGAVTSIGESTIKFCAFDVPPPGAGFDIVTVEVPTVLKSPDGITAVSCVEEANVVARALPLNSTVDAATKFVPFTVSVNCGSFCVAEVGVIEIVVGSKFEIVAVVVGCVSA